jgi:hypothetical protein
MEFLGGSDGNWKVPAVTDILECKVRVGQSPQKEKSEKEKVGR